MKKSFIEKLLSFVLALTMLFGTMTTTSYMVKADSGDIVNVTNGKTFTLENRYFEVLKNHPLYGTKDYIAYPWQNSYFIWFFNDDLSNVKFSMWDRGNNYFGLYPSEEASFTEYVYDRDTLELVRYSDVSIVKPNYYIYSYEFLASFDIYTDESYSTYFYETKNTEGIDQPSVTFEPLEPEEANDFLKFVSNAGPLVDIEEKLPEYYNLLIGEIQAPNEELKTKISFLTYLYYCLDVQLAQSNERIDMGATYLIEWIEENTETSSIIYSEIQDAIVDSLKATIAENVALPSIPIAGLNIVTAIIDYGDLVVVSLGSIDAIRSRDEIQYFLAYKELLEARATNDEIAIIAAELKCDAIRVNITFGANIEEMETFAEYLFNIEQSLPT